MSTTGHSYQANSLGGLVYRRLLEQMDYQARFRDQVRKIGSRYKTYLQFQKPLNLGTQIQYFILIARREATIL